ncbi:hypothetical protein WJX72_000783 [[Myrmecia] bisecta]|uniref:Uncharacterized protein n=1 Tax=[Myrmecia] bisecta TaxID=41462 RepID=A0AAW1Q9K0_9CHLO
MWAACGDKAHNDQKSDQRSEALATLRSHNTSLPSLQGQPIKGQVVQVDKHSVTIDTGFKTNAKFYKRGLQLSQLVSSTDKSVRESQHDFRIGDVLQFVINEPFHIYQMTEANHNVVVVDPKMMAPGSRPVGT